MGVAIGALYACGLYLMMRRSLVKLVIGLALLGHAANLLIFVGGQLTPGDPPLVPAGTDALPARAADPVPQALILTAIVIGFGVQAFALVLLKRAWAVVRTEDVNQLDSTDRLDGDGA
jgi:multicomponent Na+:H+ antiporter subunit C